LSREVVVRPGDDLWHLAAVEMSSRLGRDATTAEIGPYWRIVVEVNRSRLVHPDDPDLIFPGQTLLLP
jgi:hypothetical protein